VVNAILFDMDGKCSVCIVNWRSTHRNPIGRWKLSLLAFCRCALQQ
jgi:hypothetical protein